MILKAGVNQLDIIMYPEGVSDYLSLDKDELYPYLVDGSVSNDWWTLSESDRRILARRIIEWWSFPIKAYIYDHGGVGGNDPPNYIPDTSNPENNPGGSCVCWCEADLRYYLLNNTHGCPYPMNKLYYWDQRKDRWVWVCEIAGFNLPVNVVGVLHAPTNFGHWICAIQVGQNQHDFDSWIFFNYNEILTPGSSYQMPEGSELDIYKVTAIGSDGFPKHPQSSIILTFQLENGGQPPPTGEGIIEGWVCAQKVWAPGHHCLQILSELEGIQVIIHLNTPGEIGDIRCKGHHLYRCDIPNQWTLIEQDSPSCLMGNPYDRVIYTDINGKFRVEGLATTSELYGDKAIYTVFFYKEGWYCYGYGGGGKNWLAVDLTPSKSYHEVMFDCYKEKPHWW